MIKTKQELLNHFSDISAMYNNSFMYQTLSNMIDELLEQTRWIPCSEGLPEEHGYYITTTKTEVRDLNPYYEVQIAQFDGQYFDIGYIGDGVSVIAWRELPKPYKEE